MSYIKKQNAHIAGVYIFKDNPISWGGGSKIALKKFFYHLSYFLVKIYSLSSKNDLFSPIQRIKSFKKIMGK